MIYDELNRFIGGSTSHTVHGILFFNAMAQGVVEQLPSKYASGRSM